MKPSKNLKRNAKFLATFENNYKKKGNKFVKDIKCGELKCLSEIIRNLLLGNIPIKQTNVKRLRTCKKDVVAFGKKTTSIAKKRKILQSKGTGIILPVLASVVIPPVLEFIAKSVLPATR